MRTMYKASLRRKMITSVSATVMAALTATATAQEAEEVTDEVVVTGIRQALESSLDVKRNAKGIVDSISAEDMGKFPDSNLAESLQRVTGVSIDRDQNSGEGKTVTVRGFGADYNLVTLNGRNMPTSSLGNFASAPSSRSYDFGNLAPEAVSRVDIFKTSRASQASGGMGSTLDIRTTRPLDMPGLHASASFKTIDDKSHDEGSNSEASAILYNTWLDDRIGLAVTAVQSDLTHTVASWRHQWSNFERFGDATHQTPGNDEADACNSGHFGQGDSIGVDACSYGDVVNGQNPDGSGLTEGSLMAVLNGSAGYHVDKLNQERDNLQVTFQARPMDSLTLTLDATRSELQHEVNSNSIGVNIVDDSTSRYGMNTTFVDGPLATPQTLTYIHMNNYGDGGRCTYDDYSNWCAPDIDDVAHSVGYQNNSTEVTTIGLNAEWDVNEKLFLAFDYHDSKSESLPMSKYGSNAYIGSASKSHKRTVIDYTTEIPTITLDLFDWAHVNPEASPYYESVDHISPETRYISGAGNVVATMVNDIEQAQVNGSYDLSGSDFSEYADVIRFGASFTDNEVNSGFGESNANNWEGVLVPTYDTGLLYATGGISSDLFSNVVPLNTHFSGLGGSAGVWPTILSPSYENWFGAYQQLWITQQNKHYADSEAYSPAKICGTNTPEGCSQIVKTTDRTIAEETTALYVEASKDFLLFDRAAHVTVGLRYEDTEVKSLNKVAEYSNLTLNGVDKLTANPSGESIMSATQGGYDYVLPSVDFDFDLMEDVKLRASYNQSIARQTYNELAGGLTINPQLQQTALQPNSHKGFGEEGDPNLKPLESDNIDLSGEWYYGDISYLSVGYFNKRVSNFAGSAEKYIPVQGLIDPATSEEAIFKITYPQTSNEAETIDGIEISIQHDFADYNPFPIDLTGFGLIANFTFVDSDAEYDNLRPNSEADAQFAIEGISDSSNLIAYYERFGLGIRLAYNWRDTYLNFSGASSGYAGEYEQVDVNLSYQVPNSSVILTYDGINLNEEGRTTYERDNPAYKTWINEGHAKHFVGLRWSY